MSETNSSPSKNISFYTTVHLSQMVMGLLSEIKKENPHFKTAFDAPAGAGALSQYMRETLGLDVVALELDAQKWRYPEIKLLVADLGRQLPLPDGKFDLVVFLEGAKHVTDLSTAISELGRVMKPNGTFVMTIPNDLCLQTRLRYLFDGHVDIDWTQIPDPGNEMVKSHLFLNTIVHLPYLYLLLEKSGLQIVKTQASRLRGLSVVLSVLLYPFLYYAVAKKYPPGHVLRRELLSLTWLAGRHNILVCKKAARE
jgi:SAM-dependent methyltransferase